MSAPLRRGAPTPGGRAASPIEPAPPLLKFDFARPPDSAPRAPDRRPSSVREAIVRWLEQQL